MDKKNKKKFYCKNLNVKTQRLDDLTDTMKGVLMTTDKNKEKTCVKDAFNILNEAIERNFPEIIEKLKKNNLERRKKNEILKNEEFKDKKQENLNNEEKKETYNNTDIANLKEKEDIKDIPSINISDMLENELKSLRKNQDKLFFNFETNCKGVVFLRIDKDFKNAFDINDLVYSIIENAYKTREQISKAISRFIPIELAMKAKYELFIQKAPEIINKYFNIVEDNFGKTWKLEVKIRNNSSINKSVFFDYITTLIDKKKHPVEYKNPHFTILLEVSNDLLCFTIVRKYFEYRTYNLFSLSKSDEELRLEREKLIHLQNTADERKKIVDKNNQPTLELNEDKILKKNHVIHELNDRVEKEGEFNENNPDDSDVDLI